METSKYYKLGLPQLPEEQVANHLPAHDQSGCSSLLLPAFQSLMTLSHVSYHLSSRRQHSSTSMVMPAIRVSAPVNIKPRFLQCLHSYFEAALPCILLIPSESVVHFSRSPSVFQLPSPSTSPYSS